MQSSEKPPLSAPEYNIKAGYILLFTRYVTWPAGAFASPESPIAVGILGWDPFGKVLDETLQGLLVNGRKLELHRLDDVQAALACHVVFIANSEQPRLGRWLADFGRQPILTITESPEAIEAGAIVNFVLEGNRLRFEINRPAAEKAGIRIASPMMVSAKRVHGGNIPASGED